MRSVRDYSSKIALVLDDEEITYAHLAQRIVPIMNELDAASDDKVALLMDTDLEIYCAVLACWLCGKTLIPISDALSLYYRNQILNDFQLKEMLTLKRISFFYRMTYEDALCRIDNGLPIDDDGFPAILFRINEGIGKQKNIVITRAELASFIAFSSSPKEKNTPIDLLFDLCFPSLLLVEKDIRNILFLILDIFRNQFDLHA